MDQQALLQAVRYDDKGLIPVIAQDFHSKKVRMLAYMNEEALRLTLETGRVHYYSRSRGQLWLKGETSGHDQYVKQVSIDCDGDTLLLQIEQAGGISCHTGHASCFYRELMTEGFGADLPTTPQTTGEGFLETLYDTIISRKLNPKVGSYTNYLFDKGLDKILKKVGEEATEVVIAAKGDSKELVAYEVADLMYHLTVLLTQQDLDWRWVAGELAQRK